VERIDTSHLAEAIEDRSLDRRLVPGGVPR